MTHTSTFFVNPIELLTALAAIAALWPVYEHRDGFAFTAIRPCAGRNGADCSAHGPDQVAWRIWPANEASGRPSGSPSSAASMS